MNVPKGILAGPETPTAVFFLAHGARHRWLNMPKQPFSLSNLMFAVPDQLGSKGWFCRLRALIWTQTRPENARSWARVHPAAGFGPRVGAAVCVPSGHSINIKHHTRMVRPADSARSFLGGQLGPGGSDRAALDQQNIPPSVRAGAPGVQNHVWVPVPGATN